MEKTQQVVILAAGDFPTHPAPLQVLREADFVVCCDSAYCQFASFNEHHSLPFIVIGDGDSLSEDDKLRLGPRWIAVEEQDYNDLHKAISWAVERFSVEKVRYTILGATGRREDHTLGNISYLVTFAEEYPKADIRMLTDYGCFEAMTGRRTYGSFPRQQVSIFCMDPDVPVSADGLFWPVREMKIHRWWQATLNSALGNSFTIETEGWVVLFRTYEPKETTNH